MSRSDLPSEAVLATLTEKEREVLALVGRNYTSKEIARKLDITPSGVNYRVDSARTKLGAATRLEAARCLSENCESIPVEPFTVHSSGDGDDEQDRGSEELIFRFGDAETYRQPTPWAGGRLLTAPEWPRHRLNAWQKLAVIGGLAIGMNVVIILMLAVTEGILGVMGS